MLASETKELLDDFEKRMRFVNIVKYFTDRSFPNEIKSAFENNIDKLDNLIVMVIIYIMDQTLRYDKECSKHNIECFINEILPYYNIYSDDIKRLTEYILSDVLQNGGKPKEFNVFDSKEMMFKPICSRIISETNGLYKLTDEAYDFLFRTKEIDTELDFSISRFKLNEFIKRGNYSKALSQSLELVSRIRGLKNRMIDFMLRCVENISLISAYEYNDLINHVNSLFEDEKKQLEDMQKMIYSKLEIIMDELQKGKAVNNVEQTEKEIDEILKNIKLTIEEQAIVINKGYSLSALFGKQLDEDFTYYTFKRFNFEKEILSPAKKLSSVDDIHQFSKIFIPLYKPRLTRFFSIENLYAKQQKTSNNADNDYIDVNDAIDNTGEKIERRNSRFAKIVRCFFEYVKEHNMFLISEFVSQINSRQVLYLCEENALLSVILKLFSYGTVDIKAWRENRSEIMVPLGEFDLSYCLSELEEGFLTSDKLIISKCDSMFKLILDGGAEISITDFKIEVI